MTSEEEDGPFKVEVESVKEETVTLYGIARLDGALGGRSYADEEEAEYEARLLNEGYAAGAAAAYADAARLTENTATMLDGMEHDDVGKAMLAYAASVLRKCAEGIRDHAAEPTINAQDTGEGVAS